MEDAAHCNSDGLVAGVDRFWVVRPAGWMAARRGLIALFRRTSNAVIALSPYHPTASLPPMSPLACAHSVNKAHASTAPAMPRMIEKLRGKCLPGKRYGWVANGARKGPRRVLMETPVARLVSR
jgi:hypothetical protein